ncbi:MAG: HEPN domain-containing protein [Candidatus Eremiobacteraeota bacterium]|nr:HEPN domain-containing protein [Candidatus Eremiobacteraeota bacterium]
MNDPRKELIKYRIQKAKDCVIEVEALINVKKFSGAINRIYYSAFYIANALGLCDDFSTSKHGQLIGYFNRNYVKSGIIDQEIGKFFNISFELRKKGDYGDFVEFKEKEVIEYLKIVKIFINEVEKIIQQKIGDTDSDN